MLKRVGLFGGTFDPIHLGHLQSATTIKSQFALDEMRLLPLCQPVHKPQPLASDAQRLRCLELALTAFPDLEIETAELDRQGLSYAIDTLRFLREQNPDTIFYWVMGEDAFQGFDTWKNPDDILQLANLIVINRSGYKDENENVSKRFEKYYRVFDRDNIDKQAAIYFVQMPPIDISSTQLRKLLTTSPPPNEVLHVMPKAVVDYIEENKIYAKQREPMQVKQLKDHIIEALEDIKAFDISVLEVGEMTSVADYLIVASGRSDRQVKSLANNVQVKLKEQDVRPLGVEGEREGQWVLIDYADILVHIMLPDVRDFYNLEKLWEERPAAIQQDAQQH